MFKATSLQLAAFSVCTFAVATSAWADNIFDQGRPNGNQFRRPVQMQRNGNQRREYVNETQPRMKTRIQGGHTAAIRIQLRFGLRISGYIQPYGGLVVQNVYPGPATSLRGAYGYRYRMERGDVVEEINGRYLNSAADYFDAIDSASYTPGRRVQLGIRDINTGRINYFTTYLAPLR